MQFVNDIDLNKNELKNAVLHRLSSAPGTPQIGQMWFDTVAWVVKYYDGSRHTAGYLHKFDVTADVSLGGFKITNLGAPSAGGDAVNKAYVDNLIQGLKWKASVRVATTATISLSTTTVIDGVTIVTGDRVLVKDQSTPTQNGIYVYNGSALVRSDDADTGAELVSATVVVDAGTVNADSKWTCSNDTVTIGTTSIVFVKTSGAGTISDFVEAAQDAIGTAISAGTMDGVTLSYNDLAGSISATNTDKGTSARAMHESAYGHTSAANMTDLTDSGDTALHYHSADRNRANHTGVQAISTVTGLQTALDGKLDIPGTLTVSSGQTLTTAYGVVIASSATTADFTITLPAANILGTGKTTSMLIKNQSAYKVTIARGGTDTIVEQAATTTSVASVVLSPGEALYLVSSGTTLWFVAARDRDSRVAIVSADTTLTAATRMCVVTGTAAVTVTLPPASAWGSDKAQTVTVKNWQTGSGTLTVQRTGSDVVVPAGKVFGDCGTSVPVLQGESIDLISDGYLRWNVTARTVLTDRAYNPTSNYTATIADSLLFASGSTSMTITLPSASGRGPNAVQMLTIKNIMTAGTLTINRAGGDVIVPYGRQLGTAVLTMTLPIGASITMVCDGYLRWWIIDDSTKTIPTQITSGYSIDCSSDGVWKLTGMGVGSVASSGLSFALTGGTVTNYVHRNSASSPSVGGDDWAYESAVSTIANGLYCGYSGQYDLTIQKLGSNLTISGVTTRVGGSGVMAIHKVFSSGSDVTAIAVSFSGLSSNSISVERVA